MNSIIKTRIEEINSGKVPSGYKKTKIGIFPVEWEEKKLSEYLLISNEKNKDTKYGKKDVFSVSGEMGVVNQIVHMGRSYAGESVDTYNVVYPNDIVYTKSPLKNNPYGIIKANLTNMIGIVSVLYAVFHPKDNIIPEYVQFYFENDVTLNNYLLPLVEMGPKHTMNIGDKTSLQGHVVFPSIKEQEKIVEILKTQDRVIELKEKLLREKQREKKYLMQQLLTGKIRPKGFTDEWRKNELGSLLDYIQPAKYIIKNDLYQNNGVPVITAGKSFILGFTNEKEDVFSAVPVIVFDDFTTGCQFVDFPFKCKSSAIKILTNHKNVNLLFIYEKMKKINYKVAGHERHWISKYSLLPIYIPSYEEQNAIAEIITTKDREIALIKQQIENEKQKKKALMQLLLSGIVRVS